MSNQSRILKIATFWALLLQLPSTVDGGISLHALDDFAFYRLGKQSFPGVNALQKGPNVLLLASNQDLYRSIDSGETWHPIANPLPYAHIEKVFPHGDTLFAVGRTGQAYMTLDHGLAWFAAPKGLGDSVLGGRQNYPNGMYTGSITSTGFILRSVCGASVEFAGPMISDISDIAVAHERVFCANKRGGILQMDVASGAITPLYMGYLNGEFIGELAIHNNYLYAGVRQGMGNLHRTPLNASAWETLQNDRGLSGVEITWLTCSDRGVYVGSREHGALFVQNGSTVLRSVSTAIQRSVVQSLNPFGKSTIVTSRLLGVFITDSMGQNIRPFSNSLPPSSEYAVTVMDSLVFVANGEGSVLRSNDTGRTWTAFPDRFPRSVMNTLTTHRNLLYASTIYGVQVSADSGRTWRSLNSALDEENVFKTITHDSLMILIATNGTLLIRPNGTVERFNPNIEAEHQPRLSDAVIHKGVVYASGYPGLFVSKDYGRTWTVTEIPKVVMMRTLSIVGNELFMATDSGELLATPLP